MILRAALLPALLAFCAAPLAANTLAAPEYPETHAQDLSETIFGEEIADPYRWLENDVRSDPEVAKWVDRQNQVTDAFLGQLDSRDWFRQRIASLQDFERFGIPRKAGENYF